MSKVFFIEKVSFDVKSAKDFGELVYLFDASHLRPSQWQTNELQKSIEQRLNDLGYDPAKDFIAATGNGILLTILFALLGATCEGGFSVLYYDPSSKKYSVRELNA